MMPEDGSYVRYSITLEQAAYLLSRYDIIVSSVAYKEITELLAESAGILIELDNKKKKTEFQEDVCDILVMKLKFRIPSERKGLDRRYDINEYEFLFVRFIRLKIPFL
jgi:predicted nucleotidyltransferase